MLGGWSIGLYGFLELWGCVVLCGFRGFPGGKFVKDCLLVKTMVYS